MTGPSEVDPAVLAGEPDSVHQLERGDDDLPPLAAADDLPPLAAADDPPPLAPAHDRQQWAAADALLEGQPTVLGEQPPAAG